MARTLIVCFYAVIIAGSGNFGDTSHFLTAASVIYASADLAKLTVVIVVSFDAEYFAARAYAPVAILIILILRVNVLLCTAYASVSSGIVLMCYSCGLESIAALIVFIVSGFGYVLVYDLVGNMIVHIQNVVKSDGLIGAMLVAVVAENIVGSGILAVCGSCKDAGRQCSEAVAVSLDVTVSALCLPSREVCDNYGAVSILEARSLCTAVALPIFLVTCFGTSRIESGLMNEVEVVLMSECVNEDLLTNGTDLIIVLIRRCAGNVSLGLAEYFAARAYAPVAISIVIVLSVSMLFCAAYASVSN